MKKVLFFVMLMSQIVFAKTASWYAKGFEGKTTASGYVYNSKQMTCASNIHPFGTVLKVTNQENKKSILVVVTDTGSFTKKYGRDIDLSKGAFGKIANIHRGLIKVSIKVVNDEHTFRYKHGKPQFTHKDYEAYLK